MRLSLVLVLCVVTASTAGAQKASPNWSCAASDLAFAGDTGSATIEGQAFLKTQGGEVKVAAGNEVQLIPMCAGSTLWLAKQIKYLKAVQLDTTVKGATRTTTADGDGRFRFTQIPPGDYYAVSSVWWRVPGKYQQEGSYIAKQVHASNGQTASIVVTDK